MRILHILDLFLPVQVGYVYRSLAILAEQRRLGWEVGALITARQPADRPPPEDWQGVRVFRASPASSRRHLPQAVRELCFMRDLARQIDRAAKEFRPDILHAHSPVLNGLPTLWLRARRRLPVVYEVRAFWKDAAVDLGRASNGDLRYRATRWLETQMLTRADQVTAICQGLADDIRGRGVPAERITVIPNAVDLRQFTPLPPADPALARTLGLDGAVVLAFIGSYYRYEGLEVLLRALALVGDAQPAFKALLVGGGFEEERLKTLVRELRLQDRVVMPGRVPQTEVSAYYGLADIMVCPRLPMRLTELVTPLKPLEAMAQDRLVAASDVGGHRELIRDGETGFLFPAGDPAALAQHLRGIVERRADWPRIRANGRRFVQQERTWAASVARYRAVYAAAMGDGAAAAAPRHQQMPS
ncbi:MAG: glycosyltransferase, exosortase A system-associated [Alphaproteobacteria bacterium]|nr:glycosyltransferase, exosortase A system-associated [Alphaproteobacteria bacterium]